MLFELGQGVPKDYTVSNPAAGAGWSLTCPTDAGSETDHSQGVALSGRRWRILNLFCLLTTSSAVANRVPFVRVTNAAGVVVFESYGSTVTATLAFRLSAAPSCTDAGGHVISLPADLILNPGDVLSVSAVLIDTADQFSLAAVRVEEYVAN